MTKHSITAACAAPLLLASCMSAPQLAAPAGIEPGSDELLAMIVPAKRAQVYQCRARKDVPANVHEWAFLSPAGGRADGYEWVFVAPDAELFDLSGNTIGLHGAGPSWQSKDGSRIVGTVKARADAPVADAIPWLLLHTRTVGPEGAFSKVTSIKRVNTLGGAAPATGCSGSTLGTMARVTYSADYHLFTKR